jgi:tetratricopeptide (TPR) repeat protein
MVYGSLRSRKPRIDAAETSGAVERHGSAHTASFGCRARRFSAAALALLSLACSLQSCKAANERRREAAFASCLKSIDESVSASDPKRSDKAFASAYRKAGRTSDWLGLLKRSLAAADGRRSARIAETAARAIKAFPRSEPLRAAAAHAYLRCGKPRESLALFGEILAPDSRPELWAEAFLASAGSEGGEPRPSDYARLAEALEDPRPYLGAAAASLATGDRVSASAWLQRAVERGFEAPAELLWDCGLYDALARRADAGASSRELELMGDAAWMAGDVDLAQRRWARAVAVGPQASWRPYVNLALLSGTDSELAESYWSRLSSAFLSGPPSTEREEALASFASHLARSGRSEEALRALRGGGESGRLAALALAIGSASMPEERYAIELERLASRMPDDPEVAGTALRELARRGRYDEVALLHESASRRGLALRDAWFYEAAALAARGEYGAAASLLRSRAPRSAESRFALGSLLAAQEEHELAAREYSQAAAASASPRDRSAALKQAGREYAASGDPSASIEAYKKALAADPSDAEAAILARGVKR